jgi:small nuclear ribonucleoprotein (snRNP)-like protein
VITALRRLHKRTVVVHLIDGVSLRGILRSSYRDAIVLSHVHVLDQKTDLEGDVVVPRGRIDFFQTVPS